MISVTVNGQVDARVLPHPLPETVGLHLQGVGIGQHFGMIFPGVVLNQDDQRQRFPRPSVASNQSLGVEIVAVSHADDGDKQVLVVGAVARNAAEGILKSNTFKCQSL